MTPAIRAFVNERPLDLTEGATVADAVRAFDGALADRLAEGAAFVTDGRGIAIDAGRRLRPGAIIRVAVTARRGAPGMDAGHADA